MKKNSNAVATSNYGWCFDKNGNVKTVSAPLTESQIRALKA